MKGTLVSFEDSGHPDRSCDAEDRQAHHFNQEHVFMGMGEISSNNREPGKN